MKTKKVQSFLATIIILDMVFIYGCAGTPVSPAPATTPAIISPTVISLRETNQAETQTAANHTATAEVEQLALATANAQATLDVQATETAEFKATQRIQDILATGTQVAAKKLSRQKTETARVVQKATEQAQPLYALLQEMEEEGLISSTSGDFTPLWDFDESWAQINWFKFWYSGLNLKNFALWSKASWDIASEKANYFNSGCGIAFNILDGDNYHVVFLNMDGIARLYRNYHGRLTLLKSKYFAQLSLPRDQAEFGLIVWDSKVFFYVDGQLVIQAFDSTIREGDIGFTLMSGTNKDFGTRCQMKEAGYWELE